MTTTIERGGLTFACGDPIEVWRAETIYTKEPGTVAWIETFQQGEIFWDIGANIGVYSLLAAKRGCVVQAFEPHLGSYFALSGNIQANGFSETVFSYNQALGSRARQAVFQIRSERSGSSGSQVGFPVDEHGQLFEPVKHQQVKVDTIDEMAAWEMCPPTHLKIDVDGQEIAILYGARDTLADGVTSVQVETHPAQRPILLHYMQAMGYLVARVHYTRNGQKAIDKGADPEMVVCNTIFVREDA